MGAVRWFTLLKLYDCAFSTEDTLIQSYDFGLIFNWKLVVA
jgi:hypothetical protein